VFEEDNPPVGKKPSKKIKPAEDIDFKYSAVELPSYGRLKYPAELEYRDILVRDEKVLAMANEKNFQQVLNGILKSLLKDKQYFDELTIYDRDFLLLWIWANNYSTQKNVEVTCPHCDHKNRYDIDLTELDIKDLEKGYKQPHKFQTSRGEKINLHLLTVKDEEIARKFCNANQGNDETFVMLCLSISFDTVISLKEKIKRIENTFTGKDMARVRGFHKDYRYGIPEDISRECNGCGEVSRFEIPFSISFFLPTISDNSKKTV
jgi:RNase P subunit RPR2